jgi:hypothetical protein
MVGGNFIFFVVDEDFLKWAKTLITFVSARVRAFKIPEDAVRLIQEYLDAYDKAFEATQKSNRNIFMMLDKDKLGEKFMVVLELFIKAYVICNPKVSEADKKCMDLSLRDLQDIPIFPPVTSFDRVTPCDFIFNEFDWDNPRYPYPY